MVSPTSLPTPVADQQAGALADTSAAWAAVNALTSQVGRDGTGSPEGAVTAPVGTIYRDTAATNGAVLWVKATGAGNTGWRVAYGNTGWRNITASILNGWAATNVWIARDCNFTMLRVEGLNPASATSGTVFTTPAGFIGQQVRGALFTIETQPSWRRFDFSLQLIVNNYSAGNALYGHIVGHVDPTTAWPTSLPGTAV